ncbi:MAG: hypothetical protein DRJ65_02250 [Acidobacteria bacterium]|nr:MAG: hypothetical protein DRJ65_02250 [Acidobacteriota bacterium]
MWFVGSGTGRRWSGRSRWIERALAGVLALVVCVSPVGANPLFEAWGTVQNALVSGQDENLGVGLERLLKAKSDLGLQRVTPFAEALTEASVNRQGPVGDMLLETAKRLDPLLPAPRFMMGKRAWDGGFHVKSLGEFANGAVNMVRLPSVFRMVLSSCVPWFLMALGLSLSAAIIVQIVVFFRLIVADSYILGLGLFSRINALIFASVVVTLPLFAGLGPVWVVSYLFALLWIYMPFAQRIVAAVALSLIVVMVPLLEFWQKNFLIPPHLQRRVVEVLSERTADFVTLREFIELETELDDSAAYHVVAGELLRLHGDRELGRVEFQKALLVAPNAALPRLFLGAFSLEDRDPRRAMELLSEAVEIEPGDALAHYNLAIALDLTRRFDEGDSERRRARALAQGSLEDLGIRGQEERVLFPRLGSKIVESLAAHASTGGQYALNNRVLGRGLWADLTFSPLSLAALGGLLIGVGMLAVRLRWYGPARECDKCGKVFRTEDKTAYCEQCVSVFLKRNAVSIEQQTAKVAHVRRWELISSLVVRVIGAVVPGGRQIVAGRVVLGTVLTFFVWLPLLGAIFWIPLFLITIEPALPVIGLQVGLGFVGVAGWALTAVSAWSRR